MKQHYFLTQFAGAVVAFLLASCALQPPSPIAPAAQAPSASPTATVEPSPTPTVTPTVSPSPEPPTPTQSPPTPTYEPLPPTATLAPVAEEQRSDIFDQVWQLVRDRYVYADYRGLDWEAVRAEFAPRVAAAPTPEAFYDVMRELIDRLGDEHSRFESPQEVAEEQAEFEGQLRYAGIGAIVREVPEGGLITQLARGGPAEEAGLRPRDLIMAVGGVFFTDTVSFGPEGPISAIRGLPGSSVRLLVRSPGAAPREVSVTRRAILMDAFAQVESQRLADTNIGLLTINTFYTEALDRQVREELERLAQAGPLDGLILDVRNNSGGRLDLMHATLALFVDGGSIGSSGGRDAREEQVIPSGRTMPGFADIPLVVLIGSDTASAAEMFASGLQVLGRARLVGTASAGNTENLIPYTLADGSRLWLAERAYYRPDGSLIEGQGVQPDRLVEAEWWQFAPLDDPQIQAALEELRARI